MKTVNTPVVSPYSKAERLALSGRYDDRAFREMLLDDKLVRAIWWGVSGVSVLALFGLILGIESGAWQAVCGTIALLLSASFLHINNRYQSLQHYQQSPLRYNALQQMDESQAVALIRSIKHGGTECVRGSMRSYLSHAMMMLGISILSEPQSLPLYVQLLIVGTPLLLWWVLGKFLKETGHHMMYCVELASNE